MFRYILFVAHIIFLGLTTFAADSALTSKRAQPDKIIPRPHAYMVMQSDMPEIIHLSRNFMIIINHPEIEWEVDRTGKWWVTTIIPKETAEKIKDEMITAFGAHLYEKRRLENSYSHFCANSNPGLTPFRFSTRCQNQSFASPSEESPVLRIAESKSKTGHRVLVDHIEQFKNLAQEILKKNDKKFVSFLQKNNLMIDDVKKAESLLSYAFRDRAEAVDHGFVNILRQGQIRNKLPPDPQQWNMSFIFSANVNKLYLNCLGKIVDMVTIGSITTAERERLLPLEWSASDIELVLEESSKYPKEDLIKYGDTVVCKNGDIIYGFDAWGRGWVSSEIPGMNVFIEKHKIENLPGWEIFPSKRELRDAPSCLRLY